jgi:trigger factor
MKKFVAAALFLAAIIALGGCNTSKSTKEKQPAEATTEDMAEADVIPVEVESAEYVKLGDYKGITVEVDKRKIEDKDVDQSIEDTLSGYAETKEIKGRDVVEKGDFVNIDYTVYIDGKKNEDYSDTDVDVQVGEGEMDSTIGYGLGDDFKLEDKVIGSKVDETVTVDFTFPGDYLDPDVANKKAKMEVTIRGIFEEVPYSLDQYLKKYENGKSEKEYRAEVRKDLEEDAQYYADMNAVEKIWQEVVNNATQVKDFTDEMLAQQKENVLISASEESMYNDMTVEEYIKDTYNMTVDEYAEFSLKAQCVEELLLAKEKITVTDEEVKQEMEKLAEENQLESVDEVSDYYSKDYIRDSLLQSKLFDVLMKYNKVKMNEVVMEDDADSGIEVVGE